MGVAGRNGPPPGAPFPSGLLLPAAAFSSSLAPSMVCAEEEEVEDVSVEEGGVGSKIRNLGWPRSIGEKIRERARRERPVWPWWFGRGF